MSPLRESARHGFSMVEVTVALGLITFCLLALIGLLPAGLDSIRTSAAESGSITCLEQIASAIRSPKKDTLDPSKYHADAGFEALGWQMDSTATVSQNWHLSSGGIPTTGAADKRFAAHVILTPPRPSSGIVNGKAIVHIAWPPQAQWDEAKSGWTGAQGTAKAWVAFLPPAL